MNKEQAIALNLTLSGHAGKHIGFFHSGGRAVVKGWWEYKNGCEGGILEVDTRDGELSDFDGAGDLPSYIKEELKALNVTIPFEDE